MGRGAEGGRLYRQIKIEMADFRFFVGFLRAFDRYLMAVSDCVFERYV